MKTITRYLVLSFLLVISFSLIIITKNQVFAEPILQTPTIEITQSSQSPNTVISKHEIEILQTKVDDLEFFITAQTESYNATISRWESNLNLILVILGIIGLLVGILGFKYVKDLINRSITERLQTLTQDQIENAIKKTVIEVREKYDPKFAELYEEYRRLRQK